MQTIIAGLAVWGTTTLALLAGAALLHLLPRLGTAGRRVSAALCGGLPLDLVVTYFTALPLFVGPIVAGWVGLAAAIAGQLAALLGWTFAHELAHRNTHGRAQILRATNRLVGTGRNLMAVFWTAWAVPMFWIVRVAEYAVYGPVAWLMGMPRYVGRDWVNVSRHKFDGLVGHDRIWCLYCDWMTGVWSLGTEMLRNIESFWCPIRFSDTAKCENCTLDFPDIDNGWTPADGNMDDVVGVIKKQYGEHGEVTPRAWFGHPSRDPVQVTVNGHSATDETAGQAD